MRDYYYESLMSEKKMYELTLEYRWKFDKKIVERAEKGLEEVKTRIYLYELNNKKGV